MATRRPLVLILAGVFASLGAQHRTQNFVVEAPTPQVAQQVGQYAEQYRREKALEWLGQEMPPWLQPCPLRVTVTMSGAGGATTFNFEGGRVFQQMHIEGSLERLLASVLPHEVTHTVFAHHFRCPVPRWADEGGAVLSEDDIERNRHDALARQILNTPGRAMPLRRLFSLRDYPGDVMSLYAQGYSVTNFLVGRSNRQVFLSFVAHGMRQGWDYAAQSHYRFNTVEELEQAWLQHLRDTRRPPTILAQNTRPGGNEAANRVVVRQTVPPVQPLDTSPAPTYRGQAPQPGREGERFQDASRAAASHPGQAPLPSWPTDPGQPDASARVTLGPPQFDPPAPAQLGRPQPAPWSPVGPPR
jgi:hypothetical protein